MNRHTRARVRRRRGFTLTEMLCALILLTAFAVVGGRLFVATFHLSYNTAQSANAAASSETALNLLRSDVWEAKTIKSIDGQTVELTLGDGRVATWSIKGDVLTRHDPSAADGGDDHFAGPRGATFTTDGATLTLKTGDAMSAGGVGDIQLASQGNVIAKLTR